MDTIPEQPTLLELFTAVATDEIQSILTLTVIIRGLWVTIQCGLLGLAQVVPTERSAAVRFGGRCENDPVIGPASAVELLIDPLLRRP